MFTVTFNLHKIFCNIIQHAGYFYVNLHYGTTCEYIYKYDTLGEALVVFGGCFELAEANLEFVVSQLKNRKAENRDSIGYWLEVEHNIANTVASRDLFFRLLEIGVCDTD